MGASFFLLAEVSESGIMTAEAIRPNLTKAVSGSTVRVDNE